MNRYVTLCLLLSCFLAATPAAAQTANPRLLGDINPGTADSYFFLKGTGVLNNTLYTVLVDANTGHELRSTDLSTVTLVTDLTPGAESGVVRVLSAGGRLFLGARSSATEGYELWTSDGTASGTVFCKDIFPGSTASGPDNFVDFFGDAAFSAADHTETYRVGNQKWTWPCRYLYTSDGTTAGTTKVKDFGLSKYGDGVFYLTKVNGLLYFDILQTPNTAPIDGRAYRGLARSDGTASGSIVLVYNNAAGERSTPGGGRDHYQALGSLVFFVNVESTLGAELWKTDGTVAGTGLVEDIMSGSTGSNPSFLVAMGDFMYFTANDGVCGTELWRSDGTSSGTVLVADILPGVGSSDPQWLTPVGGKLYFTASGGPEGRQLWRYDPLAAIPLERVAIINPSGDCEPPLYSNVPQWNQGNSGYNPQYPDAFLPVATTLDGYIVYFVADDGVHGLELWQSDGTATGTRIVKDVCVGCASTYILYPWMVMDHVIFNQDDGTHGVEPWVLNPSAPLDYVYNRPPVVSLSASPTQGTDPLTVDFTATASDPDGSVTMYNWAFGDGTTDAGATLAGPSHTYSTPGSYTASVTVTDNGSATATANVIITVLSANTYVYVYDQTVTRVSKPGNKWSGRDVVLVRDESQSAVSGATVAVSYTGPNSGTLGGTTDGNGSVTLETPAVRNPSGTWCFTVTDIQASPKTFDATTGEPYACETPKSVSARPYAYALEQNHPNPFTASTQLTFSLPEEGRVRLSVYDLMGRHLRTVVNGLLPAGSHCVMFDGTGLPAGTYSVQLDSPSGRLSRMITLR